MFQDGFLYSRWENPTTNLVADAIADLEGAEGGCLVYASGMSAISSALLTFLRKGDHLVRWKKGCLCFMDSFSTVAD